VRWGAILQDLTPCFSNSNITIQGSDISAKQDITLTADNKINLLADQNVNDQVSHNSSSSSGAGVGITVGSGGGSFGITANASLARGNIDGKDTTYTNTHVTAGNALKIKSGGDTNMIGATATGQQVIADIGGDLNIASLQDTSTYDTKQQSASGSATVGVGGASASLSLNQSTINGNFASVTEQSGIKAGDGGFQIKVNGNTDLKGAVIESSQAAVEAGNNTLSTATLTSSDIDNASEYKAQSISVSGGTGGIAPPMAIQASDKDTSTTRSGISGASVVITDDAKQKQLTGQDSQETIASLNRDVTTGQDTSGAISNNLDVDQVQGAMAVTQAFVQQANTFVGDLATKSDRLKAAGDAKQAAAKEETDPAKKAQYQAEADSLYQQSADSKADSDQWAPGSTYRTIATAITAAAGGNVTGGTSQLVQGAAVNYIQSLGATEVKKIADSLKDANGNNTPESESLRAALHGIVACAGASAQGSDCSSGALGASAGSALNSILQGDTSKMTAMEKENRKNLVATLVAGIAASSGAENIATATNSAVMETENNYLKKLEMVALNDKWKDCGGDSDCQGELKKEYSKISDANDKALGACQDFNCVAEHLANINEANSAMAEIYQSDAQLGMAVNNWQKTAQTQIAPMTVYQNKIITDKKAELNLYMNQFCRDGNAEGCANQMLNNEKTAKILGELAYMAVMMTPAGVADDAKTLATGAGLDGEEANRALALFGVLTAGEGTAITKALQKSGDIVKLAKTAVAGSPEAAKLTKELEAAANYTGLSAVADLNGVSSTLSGNLSKAKLQSNSFSITDLSATEQRWTQEVLANGDPAGKITEELVNSVAERQGLTVLTGGKYGSNNGFDHVLQSADGTVTILLDSKQMAKGAAKVSTGAGKEMQLTDAWVKNVMTKLDQTSPAYLAIEAARNNGTLVKGVAGVDRTTGALTVLKVN